MSLPRAIPYTPLLNTEFIIRTPIQKTTGIASLDYILTNSIRSTVKFCEFTQEIYSPADTATVAGKTQIQTVR
ncbi:hypothetical protein QWZ13_18275 [Reinekea marina]|uniref:hypothetical protein n=1 Tax=Reinekea marina TaxID=1310421 RepID=UPI0025B2BA4C|nr:hypothetical protein [Reinekea marina]MDN3650858.1 hypothetical protein [Reinekea marina]